MTPHMAASSQEAAHELVVDAFRRLVEALGYEQAVAKLGSGYGNGGRQCLPAAASLAACSYS